MPLTPDETRSQVTPVAAAAADLSAWATAHAADAFGGLENRNGSYAVHIVRSAASADALAGRIAATTSFNMVPATWSLADLQVVADKIAKMPGPLNLVKVYPEVSTNRVSVTARSATSTAENAFRSIWANVPLDITFDDITTYTRG